MILTLPWGHVGVDDVGTGTPVVFLHGFPHTRALWSHQLAALSTRARCIAPDLRGFGASTAAGPWTLARYAEDLEALLDALALDEVVLVGLSMGGYIALAGWRRMPSRIRALGLVNTRAEADSDDTRRHRDGLIARVRQGARDAVIDALAAGMTGKSTRRSRPDVLRETRAMMHSASDEGIVGALTALRDRPDATELLATISVPTLVITGEEDVLTPPSVAQQLHDRLPTSTSSRVEIIAGAGHLSCLERPAAVTHLLGELLDELSAP